MTRTCSQRRERLGFTLLEMMLVVAIIAVMVSLLLAGVQKVLRKIPETQTRTEISQFDTALAAVMSDYSLSEPPPSHLILREDLNYAGTAVEQASKQFLFKMFGKNLGQGTGVPPWIDWNLNGKLDGPFVLEGEQALVFYLGGLQATINGVPQCLGFSSNNQNPAQGGVMPTTKRNGPYFTFQAGRLVPHGASGFFVYIDPYQSIKGGPQPFAYFSSTGVLNGYNRYTTGAGGDCASIKAFAYNQGTAAQPNFSNGNRYQIISAGADGFFGANPDASSLVTGNVLWNPQTGATGTAYDDQANFSSLTLGAGQQ
jgi:prepilin-type N-terminal cleavage/methylation domain-containing protein